jgi:translocation and assembly module TamB
MIAFFKRRWKPILAMALILGAIFTTTAIWFINSGWIENYIVTRAKAEVEKTLGAKLSIGKLRLDYWQGRAIISTIQIQGKEPANAPPLFSASEVQLAASLASFSQSRIDLRSLTLKNPKFNIITFPDGSTNIPGPKVKNTGGRALDTIVNWRLGRLEIENGEFSWNHQVTPFEVNASNVKARLDYLAPSRIYQGVLDAGNLKYRHAALSPVEGSASAEFALTSDTLRIERATFRSGPSTVITARGPITNIDAPGEPLRLDLDVDASLSVAQVLPFFALPIEPTGVVTYAGKLLYDSSRGVELHGGAKARDLFYRDATTRLGPLSAVANVDVLPARFTLSKVRAEVFAGTILGDFLWAQQEGWRFDGEVAKLSIGTVLGQLNVKGVPWSGQIHGPVEAQGGKKPLIMNADLKIDATEGPSPLEGLIALTYEEAGNRLIARNSFMALPHSRINFAGDLGKGIVLQIQSSSFAELRPLLQLAGIEESSLPMSLQRGTASVNGQLTGSLKAPRFIGSAEANGLIVQGREVDQVKARIDYGDQLLALDQLEVSALGSSLKGNLRAVLEDGRLLPTSLISGKWEVSLPDLTRLPLPESVIGSLTSTFILRGSFAEPAVDGTLRSPLLEAREVRLQEITAAFSASRRELRVGEWEARIGRQPLRGILNIKATANDWRAGSGNATLKAEALPLMSIPQFRQQDIAVNALLTTDTQVEFSFSPDGVAPSKLDGRLTLANITRYGRPVGQLEFTSRTTGNRAALTASGNIRQLPVKGDASIQLGTRLDTELRLQFPKLDFPTIAQLFSQEVLPI